LKLESERLIITHVEKAISKSAIVKETSAKDQADKELLMNNELQREVG